MTSIDGFLGNANDQGKASLEFRHRAFRDQRIFKGNLDEYFIFKVYDDFHQENSFNPASLHSPSQTFTKLPRLFSVFAFQNG